MDAELLTLDDLRRRHEGSARFDGGDHGSATSFFAVVAEEGQGPGLHTHEYTETFVLYRGAAVFTVGDEEMPASRGDVVVVPPRTPHMFRGSGSETLEMMAIHDTAEIVSDWL